MKEAENQNTHMFSLEVRTKQNKKKKRKSDLMSDY